jgi:hypothetical protein
MAKHSNQWQSSSFHGVTFSATPNQLIKLFPNSYTKTNDGQEKSNFDFNLETDNGDAFSVYDWYYFRPLKMDEVIEWHIGAMSEHISLIAKAEILAMLESNSAKAKKAKITKDQFMAFFRSESANYQLNDFDREELFIGSLTNPEDLSADLLVKLINETEADPNVLIQAFAKLNNIGLG